MFLLITSSTGVNFTIRKGDIKRVCEHGTGAVVRFANRKENSSIFVHETVREFHNKYLMEKKK